MAVSDGGPAFPLPEDERNLRTDGMSLRDWFAGQVITGRLASDAHPDLHLGGLMNTPEKVAARAAFAYRIADAMLAEREKGRTP